MNWLQRVAQGYYGQHRGYWLALWVDPKGTIYDIDSTHHAWIETNRDLLSGEYNMDFVEMVENRYHEAYPESLEHAQEIVISDFARENQIEESEVTLSEELQDKASEYANEFAYETAEFSGVELVDLLISTGWIRVAKRTIIHMEGNEEWPKFFDRAEMVLIERFPEVWKSTQINIVINDAEIYSGDVQEHGSLESAVDASERRAGLYMARR